MHASYEARLKSPTKRMRQVLDRSPSKHSRGHGRPDEPVGRCAAALRGPATGRGDMADEDRFLPMRGNGLPLPFESLHELEEEGAEEEIEVPSRGRDLYAKVVEKELLGGRQGQLLLGKRADVQERDSPFSLSPLSTGAQQLLSSRPPEERSIPKEPYKVLDAPGIHDDFYYSILDWGVGNRLGVGLDSSVYLCSLDGGTVTALDQRQPYHEHITCVKFQTQVSLPLAYLRHPAP